MCRCEYSLTCCCSCLFDCAQSTDPWLKVTSVNAGNLILIRTLVAWIECRVYYCVCIQQWVIILWLHEQTRTIVFTSEIELEIEKVVKSACTEMNSSGVLMKRWIRTIEVRVLTVREAAVSIMWSRVHLIPCVAHDTFNINSRYWTMLSDFFFPIMEDRIIQWRQTLCCIRRHE